MQRGQGGRTIERPAPADAAGGVQADAGAGRRRAGAAFLVGLMSLVGLVWIGALVLVFRLAALAPEESGALFVLFPPGTGETAAFGSILAAGGEPVRPALGAFGWIAHADEPGFAGRLEEAGALAAFRGAPGGFALAGCFAFVTPDSAGLDPLARALEARLGR